MTRGMSTRRTLAVAVTLALGVGVVALFGRRRGEPAARADDAAAVGTGTLTVVVVDEKDRPIEDAVVWALGTKNAAPVPSEPVLLEQKGLEFQPRFLVARKGQTLRISNDDPEMHNVHSSDACCAMNEMVGVGHKKDRVLDQAGEALFLCNIHAHMRCTLVVLDQIFGRTDAQGRAVLSLPLGKRKLRARALDRERAEVEVDVAAASTTRIVLHEPPAGPEIVPPEKLPWASLVARLREGLDLAVKRARAGDGAGAREAAEAAYGRYFATDLVTAIVNEKGRGTAEGLKSDFKAFAKKAEQAAAKGPEAADSLAKEVKEACDSLLEVARTLPKR